MGSPRVPMATLGIAGCALSLLRRELSKDGLSHDFIIWFKPVLDVKSAGALSKVTTGTGQGVHLPAPGLFGPIHLGWAGSHSWSSQGWKCAAHLLGPGGLVGEQVKALLGE